MDEVQNKKLKAIISELGKIKGRHTELVSVYIPAGFNLAKVVEQIRSEQSTAQNIKSKTVKKNVMGALEKILQHLKLFKQTPKNGMVIFCGNVSDREGVADLEIWSIEPPEPLKVRIYRCGQEFVMDPLNEMVREREVYGLIVLDKSEADIGLLKGKKIESLKHMESVVPGKTKAGGWCVHENTLLQLEDGRIERIADIGNNRFLCYDFIRMKLSISKHNHFFSRKSKMAYEISTKSPSANIISTPEHVFFTIGPNGFEEKNADKIQEGDRLLFIKKSPTKGDVVSLNFDEPIRHTITKAGARFLLEKRREMGLLQRDVGKMIGLTQTAISKFELGRINMTKPNMEKILSLYKIDSDMFYSKFMVRKLILDFPRKITPRMSQVLGYIMGDGNTEKDRITISESSLELIKFYKEVIEKLFRVNTSLRQRKNKGYWQLRIYSRQLVKMIDNLFPGILTPHNKEIPSKICMLRNKELACFIRGFFDAEGWVDKGTSIVGITVNREFVIRKLQLLLLRFGILSSIREIKNKGSFAKTQRYSLRIIDIDSMKRFKKEIGFSESKKQEELNRAMLSRKGTSYTDQIPITGNMVINLARQLGMNTSNFKTVQDFFYDKKGMSRVIFKKNIIKEFENKINLIKNPKTLKEANTIMNLLNKMINSEIIPVKVVSKRRIRPNGNFYDMEVQKFNNFVANGFILHNSQARYARVREGLLNDFLKKVGEIASQNFKGMKDFKGIIIGGPGPIKEQFSEGEFLEYTVKNKVIGVVNTSYTGEYGLKEMVERSEDIISEASIMREKKILERFFNEFSKDSGLAVYGIHEVLDALKAGNMDTLLLSEDSDWVKAKLECQCGFKIEKILERGQLDDQRCPNCDGKLDILAEKEITEDIIELASNIGASVEIVSIHTQKGEQLKELGGIAGILRFRPS